jgi:hypothetical protein
LSSANALRYSCVSKNPIPSPTPQGFPERLPLEELSKATLEIYNEYFVFPEEKKLSEKLLNFEKELIVKSKNSLLQVASSRLLPVIEKDGGLV